MSADTQRTILIVDNEASTRQALQDRLEQDNHRVMTASSAPQAITLLQRQPVDLLMLDLRLGGRSGLEVVRKLGVEVAKKIAILVLSSTNDPAMATDLMGLGISAEDYLVKTEHSLDDIAERVNEKLDLAHTGSIKS